MSDDNSFLTELPDIASDIVAKLKDAGFGPDLRAQQVIALAEECGEFTGAARRYMGLARRSGFIDEVRNELADVVITAFVTAHVFDLSLTEAIERKLVVLYNRGWKE